MEDLLEHWHRLQFMILALELATINTLAERVKAVEDERAIFHRVIMNYAKGLK